MADVNECGVYASGSLWFAVRDGTLLNTPEFADSYTLRAFDPDTGEEMARFTVGDNVVVSGLAAGSDAIWLAAGADSITVGC